MAKIGEYPPGLKKMNYGQLFGTAPRDASLIITRSLFTNGKMYRNYCSSNRSLRKILWLNFTVLAPGLLVVTKGLNWKGSWR